MKKHSIFLLAGLLAATTATAAPDAARISLDLRLRSEEVRQTGLLDAEALTLRTRLGVSPAPWNGWTALLEVENIAPLDGDAYSQAGINPGGAGRAVVADPRGTEINQAWVAHTGGATTLTAGRQRLVMDNARFIGDSGWRQNMQTFDAVVLQDKSPPKTTLNYAWLDRVNRVFGDRHPQGYWRSNSHLFNASRRDLAGGTLTGYAYLLDFRGAAAAQSCATYGVSFAGGRPVSNALRFTYRAEIATQTDAGHSALDYRARYHALELGLAAKSGAIAVGQELLGTDRGTGFKTPLATLHAFNGWADLFLATPAAGLQDTYLKGSATLPHGINALALYHWFAADAGAADPGREFDAQLVRKFGPRVTATLKYANFRREAAAYPNVQKIWIQAEFTY